jgi:hypothetical protein
MKTYEVKKIESFTENNYTSIYLDSYKRLWVSVYGNGLYCYQGDQLIKHFTASNSPLTYDVIHDIMERDNQLWVATDGGGINIISLDISILYFSHLLIFNKNRMMFIPFQQILYTASIWTRPIICGQAVSEEG